MNFLNLEYFLAAAEELNFTKASKRLFISQQSLSNHIAKLEEEFQVELFDRNPPMTLTPAGICLMKRTREMLSIKNQVNKEIRDIKDFRLGEITIGVTNARGMAILPAILPRYHEEYPNIQLHLFEGHAESIEEALHAGKVDLIISYLPRDPYNIESVPLFEEDFLLIVPKKILKKHFPDSYEEVQDKLRESPDIGLLKDCPFITMNSDTKVGSFSAEIFKRYGIHSDIVLETQNILTMLGLCLEGMGIIFCPEIFITKSLMFSQATVQAKACICPFRNAEFNTQLAISYLQNKYMTQAVKKFIEVAQAAMQKPSHDHNPA